LSLSIGLLKQHDSMNKQQILERYGQSVYQIRLAIAMQIFAKGHSVKDALEMADEFVEALMKENL